ncbi:MAG: xanthine dehydrogenase [Pseudorhodobacter sp. PARRP1]|nr:MAG: xanthine dehydrogenase [Pseudorhodobacter sp. PARRP1]
MLPSDIARATGHSEQISAITAKTLDRVHPTLRDPISAALSAPDQAVLAVITDVIGSSYRRPGTLMTLFADGSYAGSLTNGCIEGDLALHAVKALENQQVERLRYGAGSPFFDIRLPCGGALEISLFPSPDAKVLAEVQRCRALRNFFGLRLSSEAGLLSLEAFGPTGWIGADFLIGMRPDIRLIILGEGSEAALFAMLARSAGYPYVVASPSPTTVAAVQQAGGTAQLLSGDDIPSDILLDSRSAVVTFFHDHGRETRLLLEALRSDAFYIGAQGSRKVAEQRQETLRQIGATPAELARLVAPIGLIPSTRDARTLAISVLAEVIGKGEQQG